MEALAALGLASNIVQFLDFTWRLTSATGEIRNSTCGATERTIELDKIYGKLNNLSSSLLTPPKPVDSDVKRSKCKRYSRTQRVTCSGREHTSHTNSLLQRLPSESALLRIDHANHFDQISRRLSEIKQNLSATVPQTFVQHSKEQISPDLATDLLDREVAYTTRSLTEEDIDGIANDISNLSFSEHDIATLAREQNFLRNLDFASRRYRYGDIPEAYTRTFEWILDPSKQTEQGENEQCCLLLQWLRHSNGTFWLSGKAGSGKSTLMKYIVNHDETRKSLEAWAATKKLVIASHYFWNSGTIMQKSQQGLYRSLLYDFFRACPEQIPRVCPGRWTATKISPAPLRSENWSADELLEAIQSLIRLSDSPIKYCIFIDGVDEYEGDHFELCQLFKELSCSPNIKCCMSSRPWNVFRDVFEANSIPKLSLHELTRRDILVYAQSRLDEHPRWSVAYFPKEQTESIINSITEKAQGVFLWVYLVARSLRDGLFDGDTLRDLQRRLDSLPSDLESFFRHIIGQVGTLYHKKMAQLLLTTVNARQSLRLDFYRRQEYEDEDSDYALNMPAEEVAVDDQEWIQQSCERRINARCGGLLEIRKGRVELLHRSVRDFLLTREMNDYLHLKSGPTFKVNLSTLKIYIYSFRCWVQYSHVVLAEEQDLWRNGLAYANDAIEEDTEAAVTLLDAVEDFYRHTPIDMDSELLDVPPDYVLWSEILRAGVDRYVAIKLNENSDFFDSVSSPLCTRL